MLPVASKNVLVSLLAHERQGGSEMEPKRQFVTRTLRAGESDDGMFDLRFWQGQGAEAILSTAWDMVNEVRAMRGDRGDEPRLQRSVLRIIQRGR